MMAAGIGLKRPDMCTSCLLALTGLFVVALGQNDAPNNVVTPTECQNYVISFGGYYLREFYTCCEKPTTTGTESPCNQEPEIPNFTCRKPKGVERKNVTKDFNCNGPIGQKNAMKRCDARWGWLEQEEKDPECWAFSQCFGEACELEVAKTGSSLKGDFCGDGRCDEGTEDSDSCPMDCCPYDNVEKCQVVNNTCPDECCGQPLCCRRPLGESSFSSFGNLFIWIIVGVAGFIVLVNLCLCFCCVCCAKRCCKKHKKDKHGKKGHDKDKNTPV